MPYLSKTISGIDFYVNLESSEMYRRGTVTIHAESGEESEVWHVGPENMREVIHNNSSIKNYLKLDEWMEDGLDTDGWAQLDNLINQLVDREITYRIWFSDGQGSQDFLSEGEMRVQAEIFNFSAEDAISSPSGAVMVDEDGNSVGGCYRDDPFDNPRGELN